MLSTCPRCQKQVSIPAGVDPTAWVRCPLCAEEYALSEALSAAPPELIPVSPHSAESAAPIACDPDAEIHHDAEPENEAAMVVKHFADSAPARPRRKPKSALRTLIEVALGGLAGCLVGYYALAFYLGPEFRNRGLPELPLPGIAWLTAPRPADEPSPKPADKKRIKQKTAATSD
jgi:hypothetical protein